MEIYAYYKALGLPPDASLEEAKHAYRKLVNRWHPDRFAQNDALQQLAEEHLKLFNVAYAEVKKQIAGRPRRYRPRHVSTFRARKTDKVSPGLRKRGATGSGDSPAVLNRLTRKFRQVLSSLLYAPRRPAGTRKSSGAHPAAKSSNLNGKERGRLKVNRRKNFAEIFNEVAGPDALKIKKAAAVQKHVRLKRTSRQNSSPGSINPVSGKSRSGNSTVVKPIQRIKRVGKIRGL